LRLQGVAASSIFGNGFSGTVGCEMACGLA
jgi:hypothetical protein